MEGDLRRKLEKLVLGWTVLQGVVLGFDLLGCH